MKIKKIFLFASIILFIIAVNKSLNADSPLLKEHVLKTINELKEKEKFEQAIKIAEEYLFSNPSDYEIEIQLARLYSWTKNYAGAISIFDKYLAQNPDNFDLMLFKAQVLSWTGEYARAEILYERIIAAVPDYSDAYWGLADLYLYAENYKNAIGLLKRLEKEGEKNQKVLRKLNEGYDDWHSGYISLAFQPIKRFEVVLSGNMIERFNKQDQSIGIGFYYDILSGVNLHANASVSFNADILPVQRYDVDTVISLLKGTSLLGGFDYLGFDRGPVWVLSGGLEQYLSSYFYITYRLFYGKDFDNVSSHTHLGKIDFLKARRYHFTLGFAGGSEAYKAESSVETINIDCITCFLNIKYWLKYYLGASLNGSYTYRKNSYDTCSIGGGILFRF